MWTLQRYLSFTPGKLQQYFHDYYTGLLKSNFAGAKTDTSLPTPVSVNIHRVKKSKTDKKTFKGKVEMIDYMAKKQIVLNLHIHIKDIPGYDNTTVVYFEASPQPFNSDVRNVPDGLNENIK